MFQFEPETENSISLGHMSHREEYDDCGFSSGFHSRDLDPSNDYFINAEQLWGLLESSSDSNSSEVPQDDGEVESIYMGQENEPPTGIAGRVRSLVRGSKLILRNTQPGQDPNAAAGPVSSLGSDDFAELSSESSEEMVSDLSYVPDSREGEKSQRRLRRLAKTVKKAQDDKSSITKGDSSKRTGKRVKTHRTKTGCWICRLKHKKCDEKSPACHNCAKQHIRCEYSKRKPAYVTDKQLRRAKLCEINEIWLHRYKLQRFLNNDPNISPTLFCNNASYDQVTISEIEKRNKKTR